MDSIPPDQIESFVDACHRVCAHGLQRCSSGNLSTRLDDERMIISASRSWLGDLTPDQVSVCRISDGLPIAGPRPSVETVFHAGILHRRGDISTVLHFQSPAATAIACSDSTDIDFYVLPEMAFYIGPVGHVPYITPGTPELAKAVIDAAGDHDMVILQNHGLVTVGTDYNDAIQKADFFELVCDVILKTAGRAKRLTRRDIQTLRPTGQPRPTGV